MYLLYHHKYKWDIDLNCNLIVFHFLKVSKWRAQNFFAVFIQQMR